MIDPVSAPAASSIDVGMAPGGPGKTNPSTAAAAGADFTAYLGQLVADTANGLRTSESTAVAGVQGKASVQDVVAAVMSAEQSLQSAIAIRDKVVQAYLELSRMSI